MACYTDNALDKLSTLVESKEPFLSSVEVSYRLNTHCIRVCFHNSANVGSNYSIGLPWPCPYQYRLHPQVNGHLDEARKNNIKSFCTLNVLPYSNNFVEGSPIREKAFP